MSRAPRRGPPPPPHFPRPSGDADEQEQDYWDDEGSSEETAVGQSENLLLDQEGEEDQDYEYESCYPEDDGDSGADNSQHLYPADLEEEAEVVDDDDEDFWHALQTHSSFVSEYHVRSPFPPSPWSFMSSEERFRRVTSAIEDAVTEQMEQLDEEQEEEHDEEEEETRRPKNFPSQRPAFVYPNLSSWDNVRLDRWHGLVPVVRGEQEEDEENRLPLVLTSTALRHRGSARKYSTILLTLHKIWELCLSGSFATKRDLYYQNVNDYTSQSAVDAAVTVISAMLRIPRLQLRILSTPKGLVAGSLSYVSAQGELVDLELSANGASVPQDVDGIGDVSSDAKFVLVVEKDATFQRLLDEGFLHAFRPTILVTGKGVPDLSTRQFVHHLWQRLGVPIFALVDADPFGVEIMCSYRFGSLAMAWTCERTAVPIMRWLGVHPSDFEYLDREEDVNGDDGDSQQQRRLIDLTAVDRAKIESLLLRPYMAQWPALRSQLQMMKEKGVKAEIQAFQSSSDFIREKIIAQEWV